MTTHTSREIIAETDCTADSVQRIVRIHCARDPHGVFVLERDNAPGARRRILETAQDVAAVDWLTDDEFDRIVGAVLTVAAIRIDAAATREFMAKYSTPTRTGRAGAGRPSESWRGAPQHGASGLNGSLLLQE